MQLAVKSVSLGCLLAAALLAGCGEGDTILSQTDTRNQLHVVGSATVEATPDIATAELGVQTYAAALDQAMTENNRRSAGLHAALQAGGVAERDIRTSALSVQPQRDYSREGVVGEIVGFWVYNTVSVTLRDLATVGRTLQAGIEAGANTVNGLTFTLDDPDSLRMVARLRAMEDAEERARVLAEAAGVELGKPIRIDDGGSGGGPIYLRETYDEAAGAASVPVSPGTVSVTAQVDVIYAIR